MSGLKRKVISTVLCEVHPYMQNLVLIISDYLWMWDLIAQFPTTFDKIFPSQSNAFIAMSIIVDCGRIELGWFNHSLKMTSICKSNDTKLLKVCTSSYNPKEFMVSDHWFIICENRRLCDPFGQIHHFVPNRMRLSKRKRMTLQYRQNEDKRLKRETLTLTMDRKDITRKKLEKSQVSEECFSSFIGWTKGLLRGFCFNKHEILTAEKFSYSKHLNIFTPKNKFAVDKKRVSGDCVSWFMEKSWICANADVNLFFVLRLVNSHLLLSTYQIDTLHFVKCFYLGNYEEMDEYFLQIGGDADVFFLLIQGPTTRFRSWAFSTTPLNNRGEDLSLEEIPYPLYKCIEISTESIYTDDPIRHFVYKNHCLYLLTKTRKLKVYV